MSRSVKLFLFSMLLLFALTGCGKDPDPTPPGNQDPDPTPEPTIAQELVALLPEAGYEWIYNGFAEYGHEMRLDSIDEEAGKKIYHVTGEVFDPSGGEAQRDFALTIRYEIDEDSLVQIKDEEAMLDSIFDRLTLIKMPLSVGTSWEEQVTDQEGAQKTIIGTITEIAQAEGQATYRVRYEDQGSDYWEERLLRQGAGVQTFERLLDVGGEPFPAGYFRFIPSATPDPEPDPDPDPATPRQHSLTVYFPLADGSALTPEIRVVQLTDLGVARAAIKELIAGPKDPTLGLSVPKETKLLNIYIKDAVCYVDFSSELRDKHWGGTLGESLTIGAIVNTLTEFSTIEQVQILIEGKMDASIGGHVVLDRPASRMEGMIKQ
ncbi:MAG: GerMN domain-containing protein [Firmicutes bacterium]|nr:GerMN domain-containing protein [Bacillota bacterium]